MHCIRAPLIQETITNQPINEGHPSTLLRAGFDITNEMRAPQATGFCLLIHTAGQHTSIDNYYVPGNEARGIGGEKNCRAT